MNTQYSARPFADAATGSLVQDTFGSLIVRGSTALVGGTALTAMLAAIFAH